MCQIHVQRSHFYMQLGYCWFWWYFITKVWSVHITIIVIFISWAPYRGSSEMCQIWVQRSHFFRLVGFCWVFHYKSIVSSQYNHSHFHWFIFICSLEVSSAASSVSAASSASVSDQHQHILQHKQQHQYNLKHLPLCSFAYHQQYHQYWLVAQLDDLCIYHWFFVLIISASYQQRDWVQQCTSHLGELNISAG